MVDVALESDTFLIERVQISQRDNLKTARVSEETTVPVHELVSTANLLHDLFARPQEQVICVAEHDVAVDLVHQSLGEHTFHGGFCPDWHVDRCSHFPVRESEIGGAASALLREYFEGERRLGADLRRYKET